jgi:CO/xanthine dehydrogenase FAD-binding subunit
MKPARFEYVAAESVEETVALLAEYGGDAKVLAGGQSLVPLMNLRLARPAVLVDINRVRGLSGISANGGLTIGATTRQSAVMKSPEVWDGHPIVAAALRHVGHEGTRTRGTFGGSAAHADPAAEVPVLLVTLGATIRVTGPRGDRAIPAAEFFVSTFIAAIEEDEVVTAVHLPQAAPSVRWAHGQLARRHGDFALVGAAMTADVDENGDCRSARLGLSGVADVPVVVDAVAERLVGTRLSAEDAEEAGRIAHDALDPPSDVHATSSYRRRLAQALVSRAVNDLRNGAGAQ